MPRQAKRRKRVAPAKTPKTTGRRGGPRGSRQAQAGPRTCNDRELLFIAEFLKDFNGTEAVIRAGITANRRSAAVIATRTLDLPHVILELARQREKDQEVAGVSRQRILEEMRKVAFSDMARLASWGETSVKLIPKKDLTNEDTAAIMQIEATELPTEYGTKRAAKLRLHPKLPALQELLERIEPSKAEKRRGMTTGSGVTLIIDGGPTGLEVPTGPSVTVHVGAGAKQTAVA